MKDITILENFINDDELEEARRAIDRSSWKHKSTSNATGVVFWYADMIQEKTLCKQLVTKIEKLSGKKYKILRFHANGQTFGQDGEYHTDYPDDNVYTLLIYVSDITEENVDIIGGFTQIKRGTNIINIEPYKKKGLLFKSNMFHRGMAPSRLSHMLRVTLAINIEVDTSNELPFIVNYT
jgi:hypothetical protein|tara:strand:- start:291 stop:830 length:540 start_codon:yes stop_codon:yes gene_type:complete